LISEIYKGQDVFLATVIGGERKEAIGGQILYSFTGEVLETDAGWCFSLPQTHTLQPETFFVDIEGKRLEMLVEPFSPQATLLVFGSGHIAECLASLGKILSYQVIVIDDRPEYANEERFLAADRIYCGNFIEMMEKVPIHNQCYAVLATRGHRTDAICLSHLVTKKLPYIGMVGSKRKVRSIFSLLKDQGLCLNQQINIFAPVGLDIESETPQEIALSILAEIQLIRFGGTGMPLSSIKKSEKIHAKENRRMRQDLDILKVMAKAQEAKRDFASVTIVETTGHVPRGVGSRMIVWEDGTHYSTIGGGRRENEIKELAVQCLKEGKTYRQEVDFEGHYDSFEPVCGGRYTFFIKPHVVSHQLLIKE
jgi:xanthine dehydrogenase accessory factor